MHLQNNPLKVMDMTKLTKLSKIQIVRKDKLNASTWGTPMPHPTTFTSRNHSMVMINGKKPSPFTLQ